MILDHIRTWRSLGLSTVLGLRLNSNLSFVPAITQLAGRVRRARAAFNKYRSTNINTRVFLYSTYIRPVITYNYPIYSFLTPHQQTRLQQIQNACILHFIFTYNDFGTMTSAEAHIRTKQQALNNVMHTSTKRFYRTLQHDHPSWHTYLQNWSRHQYYPIQNFPTITPIEWARKPLQKPKYTNEHIPP